MGYRIIAAAATDNNDALASFSNYGATSVDVAAPGVKIASTKAGDRDSDDSETSSDDDRITKTGGGGGRGGCFVDTVAYKPLTTPLRWPGMQAW